MIFFFDYLSLPNRSELDILSHACQPLTVNDLRINSIGNGIYHIYPEKKYIRLYINRLPQVLPICPKISRIHNLGTTICIHYLVTVSKFCIHKFVSRLQLLRLVFIIWIQRPGRGSGLV